MALPSEDQFSEENFMVGDKADKGKGAFVYNEDPMKAVMDLDGYNVEEEQQKD